MEYLLSTVSVPAVRPAPIRRVSETFPGVKVAGACSSPLATMLKLRMYGINLSFQSARNGAEPFKAQI
jgi:hypothetical protein